MYICFILWILSNNIIIFLPNCLIFGHWEAPSRWHMVHSLFSFRGKKESGGLGKGGENTHMLGVENTEDRYSKLKRVREQGHFPGTSLCMEN